MEIRHNGAAQRAFRTMLDHYFRTSRWDHDLMAAWYRAEDDEVALEEWQQDAAHEAAMAEMVELSDAERDRLPDVPLAWTPVREIPEALDVYWNRGA